MMMDLLAGLICGLVMGTVCLGVGVYEVARNRATYESREKALPEGLSPSILMMGYVVGMPLLWGGIGGVAGIIYSVIEGSYGAGGLGSPNQVFTAAVLGIAIVAMIGLLLWRRRLAGLGLAVSVGFVIVFGWLLPLLADWR